MVTGENQVRGPGHVFAAVHNLRQQSGVQRTYRGTALVRSNLTHNGRFGASLFRQARLAQSVEQMLGILGALEERQSPLRPEAAEVLRIDPKFTIEGASSSWPNCARLAASQTWPCLMSGAARPIHVTGAALANTPLAYSVRALTGWPPTANRTDHCSSSTGVSVELPQTIRCGPSIALARRTPATMSDPRPSAGPAPRSRLPPGDDRAVTSPGGALLIADDDKVRRDRVDDGGGGLRVHLPVERHDDRAEPPDREQVDGRPAMARRPDDDPVTLTHARSARDQGVMTPCTRISIGGRELAREPVDQVERLPAGERLPAEVLLAAERDRIRQGGGASLNDLE